jgi:hypothetical protein
MGDGGWRTRAVCRRSFEGERCKHLRGVSCARANANRSALSGLRNGRVHKNTSSVRLSFLFPPANRFAKRPVTSPSSRSLRRCTPPGGGNNASFPYLLRRCRGGGHSHRHARRRRAPEHSAVPHRRPGCAHGLAGLHAQPAQVHRGTCARASPRRFGSRSITTTRRATATGAARRGMREGVTVPNGEMHE